MVNAPALAAVAVTDHCGILTGLQQVFAQRNPTLLFLLPGVFLLRLAQRRLLRLLFHEPPRTWRAAQTVGVHSARSASFIPPRTLLLFCQPAAQQTANFVQQSRGVFVLARPDQVHVPAQAHVQPNLFQQDVGLL